MILHEREFVKLNLTIKAIVFHSVYYHPLSGEQPLPSQLLNYVQPKNPKTWMIYLEIDMGDRTRQKVVKLNLTLIIQTF